MLQSVEKFKRCKYVYKALCIYCKELGQVPVLHFFSLQTSIKGDKKIAENSTKSTFAAL